MPKPKWKVNAQFDYQHDFKKWLHIHIAFTAYHYGRDFHLPAILLGFVLAINAFAMLHYTIVRDPLKFKIAKAIPKFMVRFEIQNGISVEKLIFET